MGQGASEPLFPGPFLSLLSILLPTLPVTAWDIFPPLPSTQVWVSHLTTRPHDMVSLRAWAWGSRDGGMMHSRNWIHLPPPKGHVSSCMGVCGSARESLYPHD